MAEATRIEIGFEGGQVVAARVSAESLESFRRALSGSGWHDLRTDDGILAVYLGKVTFIRIDTGEHRVGFSGS